MDPEYGIPTNTEYGYGIRIPECIPNTDFLPIRITDTECRMQKGAQNLEYPQIRNADTEYGIRIGPQNPDYLPIRNTDTEYGIRNAHQKQNAFNSRIQIPNAECRILSKQASGSVKCRILFRIRNTNAEYGMVPKNTLSFQNRGLSMQNFQSIMETGSLIPP